MSAVRLDRRQGIKKTRVGRDSEKFPDLRIEGESGKQDETGGCGKNATLRCQTYGVVQNGIRSRDLPKELHSHPQQRHPTQGTPRHVAPPDAHSPPPAAVPPPCPLAPPPPSRCHASASALRAHTPTGPAPPTSGAWAAPTGTRPASALPRGTIWTTTGTRHQTDPASAQAHHASAAHGGQLARAQHRLLERDHARRPGAISAM